MKIITVLLLTLITLNRSNMKSIETQISINASKEKVWEILMNHEEYKNWNPFIKEISGNTNPGGHLKVTIQAEGNKPMKFEPEVLNHSLNHEFRWKGKLFIKGLFDGEHYFKIIERSDNQVDFIHGENFTGILSGVLTSMLYESTKEGFEQMNKALKTLAEKKSRI